MQRVTRLLLLFSVSLVILFIVSPLFLLKPLGDTPFLISDVIDLIFTGPILLLLFLLIDRAVREHSHHHPPLLQLGKLFSVVLFFEGFGVHFSANALHHYILDLATVPADVRALIFYYDEILGHQMIFTGLFGLLLTEGITQFLNPLGRAMDRKDRILISVAAVISGVVFGLSIIDGHFILPGVVIGLLIIFGLGGYLFRSRKPLWEYPLILYTIVSLITMHPFLVGWYLVFDGFPHPSQVFGVT